jgi:hypothetical protein
VVLTRVIMDRFVARTDDLVVEELDGGLVIYDGRDARAHYLDPSAAAVWRACQELGTEPEILASAGLDATSGETALLELIDLGLVEAESGSRYSRRVMLQTAAKVGLGGAIAAPIISAIVPAAAAATSFRKPGTPCYPPGYWRQHQTPCTRLLPQPCGRYCTIGSFVAATNVFANLNFEGSNVFNALAGHLLAAELNVSNGAGTLCAQQAIGEASTLLTSVLYTGPFRSYSPTPTQRSWAVELGSLLNNYNNGSPTC